jgi:tetratricopeptide (TPR) repeat protein
MTARLDPAVAGAVFAAALDCYRNGALTQAEAGLDKLLALDPGHFDALHLSGVIAARLGRSERAVDLIQRALRQNARIAAAHRHLGNALRDLGRLEESIASYTRAIECGRDFTAAHVNRATSLLMLRRPAAALADLDRAVALGADDAGVHRLRGAALIELKRPAEAAASLERAILKEPKDCDTHVKRAAALYLLGSYIEAAASCDRALTLAPDHAAAHAQRGAALHALGRLDEAMSNLNTALALDPGSAFACSVRALCLLDLQRPGPALESCERAIALRPDLADAHNTRGLALADALRFDEAVASFDRAITLQPELAEPRFNKAVLLLQRGDFERGWDLYERRPMRDRAFRAPRWNGEEIAGRTILTYSEQGLGDTLQFCRYALLLRDRGARVVLAVQEGLCALMRSLAPGIAVVDVKQVPSSFDFHCPLLSLPRAFSTRLHEIPARIPYLRVDPSRIAAWRERLGTHGRLIGIRWQGSTGRADAGRSFHVRHFEAIAAIPGVRLISLQKGAGSEQLADLPPSWRVEDLGPEFEPGGDAFLDVAAVMQSLERVITSDTSIAHLAGALGRPTWLALKRVPDWRWLLDREDSPWYPTMRLFRQSRPGDWSGVFDRMRGELERRIP